MNIFGFWKEFRRKDMPSIFDENLEKRTSEIEARLLEYLKNGVWLTKVRTQIECPVTHEKIGTPITYTDGHWVWTTEFIFYLERYNLKIPKKFIEHLCNVQFKVPLEENFSEELLDELTDLASDYTSPML